MKPWNSELRREVTPTSSNVPFQGLSPHVLACHQKKAESSRVRMHHGSCQSRPDSGCISVGNHNVHVEEGSRGRRPCKDQSHASRNIKQTLRERWREREGRGFCSWYAPCMRHGFKLTQWGEILSYEDSSYQDIIGSGRSRCVLVLIQTSPASCHSRLFLQRVRGGVLEWVVTAVPGAGILTVTPFAWRAQRVGWCLALGGILPCQMLTQGELQAYGAVPQSSPDELRNVGPPVMLQHCNPSIFELVPPQFAEDVLRSRSPLFLLQVHLFARQWRRSGLQARGEQIAPGLGGHNGRKAELIWLWWRCHNEPRVPLASQGQMLPLWWTAAVTGNKAREKHSMGPAWPSSEWCSGFIYWYSLQLVGVSKQCSVTVFHCLTEAGTAILRVFFFPPQIINTITELTNMLWLAC